MTSFGATSTGNLDARLAELAAERDRSMGRHLDTLGKAGLAAARSRAPVGATGNFFAGLRYDVLEEAVEVGSDARHAHLVEKGRPPGRMAPPALIAALMDLPPREAFLVARSLGRRGTKGAEVFTAVRGDLTATVARIAEALARDIGGL